LGGNNGLTTGDNGSSDGNNGTVLDDEKLFDGFLI